MLNKHDHNFLPNECINGHSLCFINHDILAQLLVSGEAQSIFWHRMQFNDSKEKDDFEKSKDIFDWLDKHQKIDDRKQILKTVVFPGSCQVFCVNFFYQFYRYGSNRCS